jgi:hypothetical protein
MTPKSQTEPPVSRDSSMSAWDAAAALGIDMSLLEYTLGLTPRQRISFHHHRLKLFVMLEKRAGLARDL